ncbi:MAG: thioredoxin domain-containing protein [Spirochaetes bacterium]|nr:thioredoxin domain-containing protein [Spirochaetota bacterium]
MDKKNIKPRDILQIIQTLILVLLLAEVTLLLRDSWHSKKMNDRKLSEPKKISVNMKDLTRDAYFMGTQDAPATLVLFNSFSCGFCARARETVMKLAAEFPNDLRITYKHFNRGPQDDLASQAAECAGEQGKFWGMYNAILDRGIRGDPRACARDLGLNMTQFDACISSDRYRAKIGKDRADGMRLGVRGTPSFILNDKLIKGNRPYETFEQMIKSELKHR